MNLPLTDKEIERLHNNKDSDYAYLIKEKGMIRHFKEVSECGINQWGITQSEYLAYLNKFLGMGENLGLYQNKLDQESSHAYKQGKVVCFSAKSNIKTRKGISFSTLSNLLKHSLDFTHIYPNECNYIKRGKYGVVGFKEANLVQLQVFAIDLDFPTDIEGQLEKKKALEYYAEGKNNLFTVGSVIETHKGLQIHILLDKPSLVDKKGNTVRVFKKFALNLVDWYINNTKYGNRVDIKCHPIGIMRIPQLANLRAFHMQGLPSFLDLMTWSITYSASNNADDSKEYVSPVNVSNFKNTSIPFKAALAFKHANKVKKGKRNSTEYTLSLLLFGNKVSKEVALKYIMSFNKNLNNPLKPVEVYALLNSAYSGNYKGATKYYLDNLIKSLLTKEEQVCYSRGYYHLKKKEKDKVKHSASYTAKVISKYLYEEFKRGNTGRVITPINIPSRKLSSASKVSKPRVTKFNNKEAKYFKIKVIKKPRKTFYYCVNMAILLINALKGKYRILISDYLFVTDVVACLTMVSTDTKEINPVGKEPPKYWQLFLPLTKRVVQLT